MCFIAHRKPYLHSPPDPEKVQIARDYRKKMNKLFNITREMLAYLVYLVIVAILTYENRDTNSIYLHSNMENIFVKSQGKYHKSFENVSIMVKHRYKISSIITVKINRIL